MLVAPVTTPGSGSPRSSPACAMYLVPDPCTCHTCHGTRDILHVIPHLDRQTRVEQPLLLEDQRPALGHADVHGAPGVGPWLRSIYCETFR